MVDPVKPNRIVTNPPFKSGDKVFVTRPLENGRIPAWTAGIVDGMDPSGLIDVRLFVRAPGPGQSSSLERMPVSSQFLEKVSNKTAAIWERNRQRGAASMNHQAGKDAIQMLGLSAPKQDGKKRDDKDRKQDDKELDRLYGTALRNSQEKRAILRVFMRCVAVLERLDEGRIDKTIRSAVVKAARSETDEEFHHRVGCVKSLLDLNIGMQHGMVATAAAWSALEKVARQKVANPIDGGDDGNDELVEFGVDEAEMCQMCGGPLMLLGQLGNRLHFRCQNCGMAQSWMQGDV